ncbi:MAG: sugar transporter permease [Paenibacillaceae bacterium]|jgi:putative aldouronate transport system permease protein|nr:sugar transporter permease [Paenibacillaceae bacterium]
MTGANQTAVKRRRVPGASVSSALRKHWQLYLFLLLPLIYIAVFAYYPMAGVQLAFKKFNYSLGIWGSPWIGLENFRRFFSSYMFERVMVNTIWISIVSTVVGFPVPIIFALMLNCINKTGFKKTIQTITYMPHFISMVVLVGMLKQIFHPRVGLYGYLSSLFTGAVPPDLFADPNAFMPMYIISGVWQGFGWGSILYLAALSSVSSDLHESAQIDGASRLGRIIHVDIPAIMPTIIIMLILSVGNLLGVGFEKIFLMQNDMNLRVSEVISTFVYKRSLGGGGNSDYAFSTAVGLFNSIINLILLVSVNRIARKVSETSLW